MKAMILERVGALGENPRPLRFAEMRDPEPAEHGIVIRVSACGVCHTELDEESKGERPPHDFRSYWDIRSSGESAGAAPIRGDFASATAWASHGSSMRAAIAPSAAAGMKTSAPISVGPAGMPTADTPN